MGYTITITPASLVGGFLALCAGVSCVAVAVGWIIKGVNAARAPAKRVDERLTALEASAATHMTYFDNDKRRIDAIEAGNRVTQRAILALLAHGIDGNEIEAMEKAKEELHDYLINRP